MNISKRREFWNRKNGLSYVTDEYCNCPCAPLCTSARPSRSHRSSRGLICITSSLVSDHLKRSRSSRFCQRQKPFLSQYKTFTVDRRLLQKTNTLPEKGSSSNLSCTRIERLFICLRMSVKPAARYTFTPGP